MENEQSPAAAEAQTDEPAVYQPLNPTQAAPASDDDPNETFLSHVRHSFFDEDPV